MDNHANLSYSTVFRPPSPADSGLDLDVQAGDAAIFPLPPFNCVVCPVDQAPLHGNAEIVRVTGISDDTFTIVRAQEGTSTKSVLVGWQIFAAMTAKSFTDIEASLPPLGSVQMYLGGSNPVGGTWVLVQGGNVSRASYPAFAEWAIAEGFSYDASNIHLPDMRQRFPLGKTGAAEAISTGGEAAHTLLASEIPSHSHGINGGVASISSAWTDTHPATALTDGSYPIGANDLNSASKADQAGHTPSIITNSPRLTSVPAHSHAVGISQNNHDHGGTTGYIGGGTAHNNMPPYITVNFVIRVK